MLSSGDCEMVVRSDVLGRKQMERGSLRQSSLELYYVLVEQEQVYQSI